MADLLSFNPNRALTANIMAAAGARAFFYDAGTTNPKTVYADVGLTTPHPSPLLANSAGVFAAVYTDGLPTKVVVQSSSGATLYTIDLAEAVDAGVTEFATVAALLADTRLTYSTGAYVVGAGTILSTREEGFRYKVAASGASDHHVTTAGGVKLYLIPLFGGDYGRVLALAQIGVSADGVTNWSAQFQTVIDIIEAAGGGHIILPSGTIRAEGLIIAGDKLSIGGSGKDISIVKALTGGVSVFSATATGVKVFGLHFADFTIHGNSDGGNTVAHGLHLCGYQNVFTRVKFTRCPGDGVRLQNTKDTVGTPENHFDHCEFKFNSGWGINCFDNHMSDNTLTACIVAYNGNGVRLNSSGNAIQGWCHFYAQDDTGVDIDVLGSYNKIDGSYFDTKPKHNIRVAIYGYGNQIINNTLAPICDASQTANASIKVDGTASSWVRGTIIRGNTFEIPVGTSAPVADTFIDLQYPDRTTVCQNRFYGFGVRPLSGIVINDAAVYKTILIADNEGIEDTFTHIFTPSNGATSGAPSWTLGSKGAHFQIAGVGRARSQLLSVITSWATTTKKTANSGTSTTIGYGSAVPTANERVQMVLKDYWAIPVTGRPDLGLL